MLSARSPIAIYMAWFCLKETFSHDREVCIIDACQTYSLRKASWDETSQGRKCHLLMISSSPDDTTCKCNVCKHKMWNRLGKRFYRFAGLPHKVLRRKFPRKNASHTDLDGERCMIYVGLLATWKNIFNNNQVVKCDVTLHQMPHVFSDSPCIVWARAPKSSE